MQDIVVGSGDVGPVVAPENSASSSGQHLLELEPPVHLQLPVGLQVVQLHEVLDLGPQVPAGRTHLIAAQVDVGGTSEELIHFAHHVRRKGEGFGLREIELTVVASSTRALDGDVLVLPLGSQSPGADVGRGVDFRDDLDCVEGSHSEEFLDLVAGVGPALAVVGGLGEFGVGAELDGERFVID